MPSLPVRRHDADAFLERGVQRRYEGGELGVRRPAALEYRTDNRGEAGGGLQSAEGREDGSSAPLALRLRLR
ncbi:hypothetical protein [Streptomyces sp. T028]|uniref:hypothetical protein n=1 Tax=Streptomyces sp. T028 TaxID=3394379 RepID=UPI003A8BA21F